VRDKRTRHDAATAIFYAANALAVVSLLLKPFIPRTAEHALKALNIDEKKIDINKIDLVKKPILKSGHAVRSLILFQKVEDSEIEKVIITSQQSNRI
jgi:methionyl-tRNA synthetase